MFGFKFLNGKSLQKSEETFCMRQSTKDSHSCPLTQVDKQFRGIIRRKYDRQLNTGSWLRIMWRQTFISFTVIILFATGFLFTIELMKSGNKRRIECIVNSLKLSGNIQDEAFDSVGIFFGDSEKCEENVRKDFDHWLDITKLKLNEKIGQRQYTNCVVNRLRNHQIYMQMFLLTQVLEHTKVSWSFWKYFDRKGRLEDISEGVTRIEDSETQICVKNRENPQSDDDEESGSGSTNFSFPVATEKALSGSYDYTDDLYFEN